MSSGAARPVPIPDELSAPYWDAARQHQLTAARCGRCENLVVAPAEICPVCGSTDPSFRFEPISGRGVVRSWAVVRQSFLPGFEVPFVLVDVELAEQPDLRVVARLVDGSGAAPVLGSPVTVAFEDLPDGTTIPAFALATSPLDPA